MSEPTIKDVLAAIAKQGTEISQLRTEINARFDKVDKRFDDIDAELTTHTGVHRKIEKDIAAVKTRVAPAARSTRSTRRR